MFSVLYVFNSRRIRNILKEVFAVFQMSTLEFVRKLQSYSLDEHGAAADPFVASIITEYMPHALPSLAQYSRGMYTIENHVKSFSHFGLNPGDHDAHM